MAAIGYFLLVRRRDLSVLILAVLGGTALLTTLLKLAVARPGINLAMMRFESSFQLSQRARSSRRRHLPDAGLPHCTSPVPANFKVLCLGPGLRIDTQHRRQPGLNACTLMYWRLVCWCGVDSRLPVRPRITLRRAPLSSQSAPRCAHEP